MKDTVIVIFENKVTNESFDLEVPLNITANELFYGLNKSLHLGVTEDDYEHKYLCLENPIALLRGDVLLEEFHIRNGSKIVFTR